MIRESGRIRIVLFDLQLRLVIEQAIQDVRRITNRGVDDLGMEGSVLI